MTDVIRCTPEAAEPIHRFGTTGSSSVHLGSGSGESHAYVLHFEPDGEIGVHEAGFDQLFLVVSGEAWLNVDGDTVELRPGEAGVVPRGSMHAKGSRSGGTAVMVQMQAMTGG
jgi:quercetin dioxygenase-like cupin family protein